MIQIEGREVPYCSNRDLVKSTSGPQRVRCYTCQKCGFHHTVISDDGLWITARNGVEIGRRKENDGAYPVANTGKDGGRCCQPFGRSTIVWGAGKEYPVRGEDFAFMLFRKRNCCVGY